MDELAKVTVRAATPRVGRGGERRNRRRSASAPARRVRDDAAPDREGGLCADIPCPPKIPEMIGVMRSKRQSMLTTAYAADRGVRVVRGRRDRVVGVQFVAFASSWTSRLYVASAAALPALTDRAFAAA